MAAADDLESPEPARTATSALGSTSLLMAVIVLMSALGSFGAVRAWFPKGRTAPAPASTVRPTAAAAGRMAHDIDLPHEVVDTRTPPGRLSIVTDPPGAQVAVDGQPRGVSPVVIDGLAAAEHRISVVSDAGVAERTIAVSNYVMTEVVFSLARPMAPLAGWVSIASPFLVEMVEHDEVVGTSDAAKIMLAAGTHQVLLRNETLGVQAPRTVTVVAGRVTALDVIAPKALVNVNARPWADVLIDGTMVGQTPLSSLSLAVGPHQVLFRHPQFGERTERIVVTAHGVNRVAVDLTK
jgi:hypothetical protein